MNDVEDLIKEMQATKTAHPTLSISEVLQLYNIQAMRDLSNQLKEMTKQLG